MSKWKQVEVGRDNENAPFVVVGGGATIGEMTTAAENCGLMMALGDRPSVGIGLVLQGGINH
jgi:hypothetical protein